MKRLMYIMTAVLMFCQVGFSQLNTCNHSHEVASENQMISPDEARDLLKAEAFALIQPYYQETLAKAIEMAKNDPEAFLDAPATCFAPDTDPKRVAAFYERRDQLFNSLDIAGDERYVLTTRWTATATDGGGLGQGDPTTLTWSYVPDGTAITGNCDGEAAAPSNFIAFFNGVFGTPTVVGDLTTAPWHSLFVGMFASWSDVAGLTFVYEPNDDGADAAGPGSSPGALGVRGDIRITGHSVDGNSGILACNYFPTSSGSGDMIIDTGDNYYANNPDAQTVYILAHEVGHGLGLRHSCPRNVTKLMEPSINVGFNTPQEDDILAANRHYGDPDENNNNSAQATFLGANPLPATYMVTQNSIDDNGDTDTYSVMVNQPAKLTATLVPTGTTYLAGAQNADGSCQAGTNFDALREADVQLEILDTDGVTLIGSSGAGGAGQQEMVFEVPLPSIGTYYVRVSQQGALIDVAQMYDLDVEVIAACALEVSCATITDETLSCRADLPPVDFDLPIVTQSCGNVILSALTIIPGNSGCPGDPIVITRTYFLQDDQGNMAQCMQTFTVVSNVLPTITCPPGGTVMCNANVPAANVGGVVTTAECGMATVSVTGPVQVGPDNCPGTTFTYTYTATDECNRMVSCDQVYTIANDPPTIVCPANQLVSCFEDIIVLPANAVVTTSCGLGSNVTVAGPVVVGENNCTGTTYTYTYTVIDDCGRAAQCQQVFTISSSFLSISCPAPEIVECAALIDADPEDATVNANCDIIPMVTVIEPPVIVGIPDCPGTTYTYTYQATSPCFPGLFVSCQRVFTIANDPPQIICPPPAVVECVADIVPDITLPNVFTSCTLGSTVTFTGPTLIAGIPDCPGTTYGVTYTVEDDCGRMAECTQVFTIENDGPTITCPADEIVECAADIMPDITLPVVTTSCTLGFTVTFVGPTLVFGTPDCPGARYEVVYTVEDDCGRTADCTQTFTIQNDGPTIVCPAGFVVECADDIVVDPTDATVTTSCMLGFTVTITGPKLLGGLPDCPGTEYKYFYTVIDDCGRQALCERSFFIENDPPTITCPANETVECESDIVVDINSVTFTTSCDMNSQISAMGPTLVGGADGCDGAVYEVTYLLRDACGRTAECTQTWTLDNEGPVITECAPDRIVECRFDIVAELDLIVASSSCGLEYEVFATNPIPQDNLGGCPDATYLINYFVIDACGRVAECFQTWTLENSAPIVTPPDPITIACLDDLNLSMNNAKISTSCGIPIVRTEIIGPIYDDEEPLCNGSIVNYLYSVWDACGRMTCEAQVITIDASGSQLGSQFDDMTVGCDDLPPAETSATACGVDIDLEVTESILNLPGGDFRVIRDYVGIDACGEEIEFRQIIDVECSNEPPGARQYCTLSEASWSNGDIVENWDFYGNLNVSSDNPVVLGYEGREIIIVDIECVYSLLPGFGAPTSIDAGVGTVEISEKTDCLTEVLPSDEQGTLKNSLLTKMIALTLNLRADPDLAQVIVAEICQLIDPNVQQYIGGKGTIRDLHGLGESALMGYYEGSFYELSKSLDLVMNYFENCSEVACSGGSEIGIDPVAFSIDNMLDGQLELYPNPSTDVITVRTDYKQFENLTVRIYASTGQILHEASFTGADKRTIDVNDYPSGLYHLVVFGENKIIDTVKFLKQE